MYIVLLSSLIFSLCFQITHSARILVTSLDITPSQSLLMGRVADLLVEDGHDATLFRSVIMPKLPKPKPKLAKEMSYLFGSKMEEEWPTFQDMTWKDESVGLLANPLQIAIILGSEIINGCEHLITDEKTMNALKDAKFDAMIIYILDVCMFGVAQLIGVKTTVYFSTSVMMEPMPWFTGTPSPASYVPTVALSETDRMDFFARMYNLASVSAWYIQDFTIIHMLTQRFRKHFGQDFPHINDLIKEVQLTFIYSDPFLDFPRPTLHNVIYVGGLTMESPKPLDLNFQKIVNESLPNGIVLFSLGTSVQTETMPLEMKASLLETFTRFPKYTFICRLKGEIPIKPHNVKFVDWIPQKELLYEPKVKLFISHGGIHWFE